MPDDRDVPEADIDGSELERPEDSDDASLPAALDDGAVGYKRPPRKGQFPPGKSGNPGGRPVGSRGLGADLKAELDERVTVTIDGRPRRIPKRRLIIKALAQKAAKGDVRAADKLLQLVIQSEGFEDQRQHKRTLSDQEQQLLDRLFGSDDDEPTSGDNEAPEGEAHNTAAAQKLSDNGWGGQ
jgi:hypothetical protein